MSLIQRQIARLRVWLLNRRIDANIARGASLWRECQLNNLEFERLLERRNRTADAAGILPVPRVKDNS